ncbi:MAG: hypothetical protein AAFX44_06745 [Pseudomonadota bacterium]
MKYRKKPVVIEAMQLPERDIDPSDELVEWLSQIPNGHSSYDQTFEILTLEGAMTAAPGDYIIKGVKGEFYPCKPDIFEATYDPVDEQEEKT